MPALSISKYLMKNEGLLWPIVSETGNLGKSLIFTTFGFSNPLWRKMGRKYAKYHTFFHDTLPKFIIQFY